MNLTCRKSKLVLTACICFVFLVGILYWLGFTKMIQLMVLVGGALVFFAPPHYYPFIIIFVITNRALFREVGFDYFYNFALLIMIVKKILFEKKILRTTKEYFKLLFFLFITQIGGLIWFDNFDFQSLISTISWFLAVVFVLFYLEEYIRMDKFLLYKFFCFGFISGCICELMVLIYKYDFRLPYNFRFSGMIRETNLYGMVCLILAVSTLGIKKISLWKRDILFAVFVLLGIISMSKAFILFLLLSLIVILLKVHIKQVIVFSNKQIYIRIIGVACVAFLVVCSLNTEIVYSISQFVLRYMNRFLEGDFSSGRLTLWRHYINAFWKSLFGVLFGYGLNYNEIPGFAPDLGKLGKAYFAHCTYFDIILSFGIFGTVCFAKIVKRMMKEICSISNRYQWINSYITDMPLISLFIGILSLSLLNGDYFIILLCTVMVMSKKC